MSETFRVSCQNKFVKLVHLVGFIIKKIITPVICTFLKRETRAHFAGETYSPDV
jgi:hypothetical protein